MDEANINGITVSLHPGMVRTEIVRDSMSRFVIGLFETIGSIFTKTPEEGAHTTLYTVFERE